MRMQTGTGLLINTFMGTRMIMIPNLKQKLCKTRHAFTLDLFIIIKMNRIHANLSVYQFATSLIQE